MWVLMPENPAFEEDPEVGPEVRARSDATAAALRVEADALGVDLIDLRHGTPREGFLDLNHLFYEHGGLAPRLARALGERGLLGPQP